MSNKATICLSAVCLILIAQISGAFEVKPCKHFKGKLLSLEVQNCPDKTADYCEIKIEDQLHWDIKYVSAMSHPIAWTGFMYDDTEIVTSNHCERQPNFCPGKKGQVESYHYDFNVSTLKYHYTDMVRPLQLFTQPFAADWAHETFVVCAEFPAKFVL